MREKNMRAQLARFEVENEKIKKIITDFQLKVIDRNTMAERLSGPHTRIVDIIQKLPGVYRAFMPRLNEAYINIKKGLTEFVAAAEKSYHNILFELHDLLLRQIQKAAKRWLLVRFTGWAHVSEMPAEARDFAHAFNRFFRAAPGRQRASTFITKRAGGWKAYIKMGQMPVHYTILYKDREQLTLTFSDYVKGRAESVKDILTKDLLFNVVSEMSIKWTEKEMAFDTNYLTEFTTKGEADMERLVSVLFWSNEMPMVFGLPAKFENEYRDAYEMAYKKEVHVRKRLLRHHISKRVPKQPTIAFFIYCSNMIYALLQSSYTNINKMLDDLLSAEDPQDFIKKKYGIRKEVKKAGVPL